MSRCSEAFIKAVGEGLISKEQADKLVNEMRNAAARRKAAKSLSDTEALAEIAGEMKAGADAANKIMQRNRLLSLSAVRERYAQASKNPKLSSGLRDALETTSDIATALERRFMSRFDKKLSALGLDGVFRSQKMGAEFYAEAWNVGSGGTKPVLDTETGRAIHELMKFYVSERSQRNAMLNRRGAYFPEHDDYGFMQSYSTERVRALGGKRIDDGHKARAREGFLRLVSNLNFDPRTFEGRDVKLFWNDVFDNLYSGRHIDGPPELDIDAFSGVHGSLANKLSTRRLIWFADSASQYAWNQAIGSGGYAEIMMREMGGSARSLALMTEWGPNWKNNVDVVATALKDAAVSMADSAKQTDALNAFNLKGYISLLSGEADIPKRPTLAKVMKEIVAWTHVTKMGGATIASIPDLVMVHDTMAANGISRLDALGAQLNLRHASPDVLQALNVVSHSFIGSLHNRFGASQFGNITSRAAHRLFELNFFNRWNDMNMEVAAKTMSWWLGKNSHLEFDALPAPLKANLERADVRRADWNAIRSVAAAVDVPEGLRAGEKYVLVDSLRDLPDLVIGDIATERGLKPTPANLRRTRDDVEMRLSTFYSQQVDDALNTPGLATKYITTFGGAQSGTFPRAVADLLMIFKSFPISVALRMKRRAEAAGVLSGSFGPAQRSFMWRKAQMMAAATVAGYVAMTTRDLLNGRTRRQLFDENGNPNATVFLSAMSKGGGIGIFGDVLFSEYDRQYKSALNVFAGPVVGMADQLGSIYTNARAAAMGGEATSVGSDLFNVATSNLPFGNLFYVRPILNNFLFYNIREALSPGTLRRAERTARQMNYQDFYIEPSAIADIPVSEPGRKIKAIVE